MEVNVQTRALLHVGAGVLVAAPMVVTLLVEVHAAECVQPVVLVQWLCSKIELMFREKKIGNQASPRISPSSSQRTVSWLVSTATSLERIRKRVCPGRWQSKPLTMCSTMRTR